MTYFENYDIGEWLEECLTRHPRPAARSRVRSKPRKSAVKDLLLPIVSAGSLFAAHASLAVNAGASRAAGLSVQSDSERVASADPYYWLGTVRVRSKVADFNGRVTEVCRQLRAGRIADIPTRTWELAAAIHQREAARKPSADDSWITDLANSVAKLTD